MEIQIALMLVMKDGGDYPYDPSATSLFEASPTETKGHATTKEKADGGEDEDAYGFHILAFDDVVIASFSMDVYLHIDYQL